MKKYLLFIAIFYGNFTFAQLNETFITNTAAWTGSNSGNDFVIVDGQLRSNVTGAADYYLSTPNTLAANCQWEFYINLQFAPNSSNYVDVYLISDQSNLLSSLINGYFIRFGNTTKEISLYKRSGTASSSIRLIDGIDEILDKTNNKVKVKITRTADFTFILERDITGTGTSYVTEGTFPDASYTTSAHFGIFIKQSSATGVIKKHFFDDIRISPIITDTSPPELLSALAKDSTTIEIVFNEPVDSLSAKTTANYLINNNQGNPILVKTTPDPSKYILILPKGLSTALYTISVSNISDKAGNIISTNNIVTFSYIKPFIAQKGDLVINEIFADPTPQIDLPSVEFIELFNTSNQTIHLKNWKYSDPVSTATLPADSIKAGEYLILCAKADTNEFKQFGKTLGISPWPSLNNASDIIKLISPENTTIDSVAYSDSWHTTSVKKQGGWSLERIDYASVCKELFNWTSSTDISGGTPGRQNSVFIENYDRLAFKVDSMKKSSDSTLSIYFNKPADILTVNNAFSLSPASGNIKSATFDTYKKQATVLFSDKFTANTSYKINITQLKDCAGNTIVTRSFEFTTPKLPPVRLDTAKIYITEIFADPSPEVKLPLVEFVEIYNPGKDTIDLEGWTLHNAKTKSTFKKSLILPNEYIILCPVADTTQYLPYGKVIGLSGWPTLTNITDQVFLKSFKERIVDSITYSDSWHTTSVKKQGGWSLERIDYASVCKGLFNWTSSTDISGGTPGRQNSVFIENYDQLAFKADSIKRLSDSTLTVYFNKLVDIPNSNTFILSPASGNVKSVITDNVSKQVRLLFSNKFAANTTYTLTLNQVKDCAGNLATSNALQFTTPKLPPVRLDTAKIYITEIFADPSPEVKLPLVEFVEIYNPGKDTIDLDGWTINDPTARATIKKASILPQQYIILCPIADTLQYKPFGKTIGLSPWPSLNNASDQISLKSFTGRLSDSIAYQDSWYKDAIKKGGGWSLELIDPLSICTGIQNWIASTDSSGGTPGRQNSVYKLNGSLPLRILQAAIKDSTTISILFNKPPDSLSASRPDNFSINNGVGKPSAISLDKTLTEVQLRFSAPIARGNTYRVSTRGITDCSGSEIASANGFAEFYYPHKISKNSILVNEVLFNPRAGGVDFVEIYNNSGNILDLKELSIATLKDPDTIISRKNLSAGTLFFQPKSYLVLTTNPDNIRKEYHTGNKDAFLPMASMPAFNNDAGTVVLLSGENRIDQFSYTEKMHFALIKDPKGISLERINFEAPTNEKGTFRSAAASVGYATPGYKNSQSVEPPDIINKEVSLLSKTFSPDNDGFEDYLQINYRFKEAGIVANVSIYNDQGLLIKRLAKNTTLASEGFLIWDGMNENGQRASLGIYIVYFEGFDLKGTVKKYKKACVLAAKFN